MSIEAKAGDAPAGRNDVLDELSYRVLAVLRDDGRISIAALADRLGISRATAYSRIDQLTRQGVITGFCARISPERAGLSICALVFVTVHPQSWPEFRRAVLAMPDVDYCAVTTGEHDAMLRIRATDVARIHEFATGVIAVLPQVRTVVSVVVLDEVVTRPYVLPTIFPRVPRRHVSA